MATESAHSSAIYLEIATDDIDEWCSWDSDRWEDQCVQLSAGPLGFWVRVVDLPGLRISWNRFGQAIQNRTRRLAGGLSMVLILKSDEPTSYEGSLVETNEAFLFRKGDTTEYVTSPGVRALIIEVDEWLVSLFGWRVSDAVLHRLTKPIRKRLEDTCLSVTDRIRKAQKSGKPISRNRVSALRTKVINALGVALQPWLVNDPPPGRETLGSKTRLEYARIVQQAGFEMAKAGPENPLPAAELSRRLGVSERTLYRAFKEWVDLSPAEYLRIHKLHCFRNLLLRENGGKGAISRAAGDAGFDQFGRLAGIYKEHFGEKPGETLKRKHKATRPRFRDLLKQRASD